MSAKSMFTPRHRKPRLQKNLRRHQNGMAAEERFFALVADNPHWLPVAVREIQHPTRMMDRSYSVDAIVVMHDETRLYLDIKSCEGALNHKGTTNRTIPFVLRAEDTAEVVLANFKALINREYARVISTQAEPLLARLAARPLQSWAQAAE